MDEASRDRFRASALFPDWPAPPAVLAFSTLRGPAGASSPPFDRLNLGARGGDDPLAVARNRSDLVEGFGLPSSPHWLQQVHGTAVVAFDRPADALVAVDAEPVGDAAITSTPGVVVAILTADCLPVLFCRDDGRAVGAAHAGWRGLAAGVLERTIEAMDARPNQLLAWLGPAAGPQGYEVGGEVRDAFLDADPEAAAAFMPTRPGHWLCDLYVLARLRLASAGVSRVHGGGLCTISDPRRFFSHRREGRTGRMASLICINPGPGRA